MRKVIAFQLGVVLLSLGAPVVVRAQETPFDRGMAHLRNREFKLAIAAFEEGVAKGDAASMYGMGGIYRGGIGRPESPWIAFGYYRQAAELGHDRAHGALGNLYFNGLPSPPDLALAAQWWEKGSDRGDGSSAFALGQLHYLGDGVPRNLELARKYWNRSKELGFENATVALAMVQAADSTAPPVDLAPLKALAAKGNAFAPGALKYLELAKADASILVKDSSFIRQAHNCCGVACTTMLLQQQRVNKSQMDIAQSRTRQDWNKGTPWDDLVKIAGKSGQSWKIETYPNTDEGFTKGKAAVIAQLKSGTPIMIDILVNESDKSAHTILMVGFDAKTGEFLARDPSFHFPGFLVLTEARLKTIWRSRGFIPGNTELLRPTLGIDHKNK